SPNVWARDDDDDTTMPCKARKRPRTSSDNSSGSNNPSSRIITGNSAQTVPEAQNNPSSSLDQIISQFFDTVSQAHSLFQEFCIFADNGEVPSSDTTTMINIILPSISCHYWGAHQNEYDAGVSSHPPYVEAVNTLRDCSKRLLTQEEKSVATEPIPEPSKPSYSNVGCATDSTPTPSAQTFNPSPSPKSGPRPPRPPCPKKAQPLTSRPRSHQVRSNVRLVACIAGRADAVTSTTPRWKEVPTDCFSSLSKDFKAAAPGCTPLRFHCNQKGNLIITFAPTTSRSLLMSNLNLIRGNFELAFHVPILFDTPRSTLHLTHVPARSQDGSPIFDQSALAESILANPALSTLPLTSPPRWLRHPSQITGIRSSAVLSFEDPDGAIIQQLLKTPLFVFGQPVTVKPWINKPPTIARLPQNAPARDHAMSDI
ncbi:hypothetical protein FRC11_011777, partial [Ceratobasidium sp. 423]